MRIQISTNVSTETRKQADELIERCGYSLRDVVTIAIEKLHTEKIQEVNGMTDYRMTTRDRVAQVGWLNELATNIVQNLGDGTAEELVEYAMGEGRESWGVELPEWFDDSDRRLLVEMIEKQLNS